MSTDFRRFCFFAPLYINKVRKRAKIWANRRLKWGYAEDLCGFCEKRKLTASFCFVKIVYKKGAWGESSDVIIACGSSARMFRLRFAQHDERAKRWSVLSSSTASGPPSPKGEGKV